MAIKKKDLPFIDFYSIKEKSNKKIRKVVFPNDVCFGIPSSNSDVIISGSLTVLGSFNQEGGGDGIGADPGASYVLIGTTASLANERALTAGTGIDITDNGAGSTVVITNLGGVDAPSDAQYLTLATDGDLSQERVFTPSTGLKATDDGANGNYTVTIDDDIVATVSGTTFTGPISAPTGTFGYLFGDPISGSALYLAGAQSGEANTIADDLVIGVTTADGNDRGITIQTRSSQDAYIMFGDQNSNTAGGFTYDHGADVMRLRAGSGDRAYVTTTELAPNSDTGITLGATTRRWSNFYSMQGTFYDDVTMGENLSLTGSDPIVTVGDGTGVPSLLMNGEGGYMSASELYLAGAAPGDAVTTYDTVVIGNGSGQEGITLRPATNSQAGLVVDDGAGFGRLLYSANANAWFFAAASQDQMVLTNGTFYPGTDDDIIFGLATNRLANIHAVTGTFDFITNGTGSFYHMTASYASVGGANAISQGVDLAVQGTMSASALYLAGAQDSFAPADANDLVIGNASTDAGITIFSEGTSLGRLVFTNENFPGGQLGAVQYDHEDGQLQFRAGGGYKVFIDANEVTPASNNSMNFGRSSLRWANLHVYDGYFYNDVSIGNNLSLTGSDPVVTVGDGTGVPSLLMNGEGGYISASILYLAGAQSGDANSDADDLVIGQVDGTRSGMTFLADNASGNSFITFADSAGGSVGYIQYQHNGDTMYMRTGGSTRTRLNSSGLQPNTNSGLDLGSTSFQWTDLYVSESIQIAQGASANALLRFSANAGSNDISFRESSTNKWVIRHSISAGGDLQFNRQNGSSIDNPLVLDWPTGELLINSASFLVHANPRSDLGADLGASNLRWDNLYAGTTNIDSGSFYHVTASFLSVGGANAISDGVAASIDGDMFLNSASPTLRVGNGTGTAQINIVKSDAGEGIIDFEGGSAGSGIYWRFINGSNEDFIIQRWHNSAFRGNALRIQTSDGEVRLEQDLSLTSSSPTLTVGDGAGSVPLVHVAGINPGVQLSKTDAGQGYIDWYNEGSRDWRMSQASNENWYLTRYDGANFLGNSMFVNYANGDINMEANLSLTSSSPTLTLGDGTGNPDLLLYALSAAEIKLQRTGFAPMRVADLGSEFNISQWNGASWDNAISIDSSSLDVTIPNDLSVGGVISGSALHLSGAAFGDAPSEADDIIIAAGDAQDRGITINAGSSNVVYWNADSNTPALNGYRSYDLGNNRHRWAMAGVEQMEMVISPVSLRPIDDAGMSLGGPSNRWNTGSFVHVEATTKRFVIDHPTKPNMKLVHASLEGPENGVYVRGRVTGSTIELPGFWEKLVDWDSVTVQLTSNKGFQMLYVEDIVSGTVTVKEQNNKGIDAFYLIHGERIDVDRLIVEKEK
jgi:hypothetical protein